MDPSSGLLKGCTSFTRSNLGTRINSANSMLRAGSNSKKEPAGRVQHWSCGQADGSESVSVSRLESRLTCLALSLCFFLFLALHPSTCHLSSELLVILY